MPNLKEWGIYVYIAADVPRAGMRTAAKRDLQHMATIGPTDQVVVAAQLDLPRVPTNRYIFPLEEGARSRLLPAWTHTNVNSADPKSIVDFFTWAAVNCPARNIMFVLWGHGYGLDDWDPFIPETPLADLSAPTEPGAAVEQTSNVGDAQPILGTNFLPFTNSIDFKGILDESHHSVLNNFQIGDAVRQCRRALKEGQNLAILGFDCCEMAMAEVLAEMTEGAAIGFASQAGVPYTTWPYNLFLNELIQNPNSTPDEVVAIIFQQFQSFYSQHPHFFVTLSAYNFGLLSPLEEAVKPLVQALIAANDPKSRETIFQARNSCPIFDPDGFIDFDCFCRLLQKLLPGTKVSDACEGVRAALGAFVIHSGYSPQNHKKMISLSTGLSIWFPPWIEYPAVQIPQKPLSVQYLLNGYQTTRWSQTTGWNEFLLSLLREDRTKPESALNVTTTHGKIGSVQMAITPRSKSQDKGGIPVMKGRTPPLTGRTPTLTGRTPPLTGRTPPLTGRTPPLTGRTGGNGPGIFMGGSTREAGVIVRASVEAYGPVGDTELQINVRWPAGNIGVIQSQGAEEVQEQELPITEEVSANPPGVEPNLQSDIDQPALE